MLEKSVISNGLIRAFASLFKEFSERESGSDDMVSGMGVGRIFSRGTSRGFSQIFFQGGPKVVKFGFHPSKLKKQPFLLIISKSRGVQGPPLPTPMVRGLTIKLH